MPHRLRERWDMNSRISGALFCLLAGCGLPVSADDAAPAGLRVEAKESKLLTVRSTGAPLYGVLWAISAQTGIRLNVAEEVLSEGAPVVEDFTDRPLKEGVVYLLERYLQGPGYTLVTNSDTGELESVHVFAGAFGRSPTSPLDDAAMDDGDDSQPPGDREIAKVDGAVPDPMEQALETAWASTDPREQIEAIQVLEHSDDPRVLEVLRSALRSQQPEVQQAALEAIPWASEDASIMLDDVRALAAEDPEPAVRQAAVMVLARQDDFSVETRAMLEALASEEGTPNQDVFRQHLDRMMEEELARSLPDMQGQSQ
jgi:hypothetical protein